AVYAKTETRAAIDLKLVEPLSILLDGHLCRGSCQLPLQNLSSPYIAQSSPSACGSRACAGIRRSLTGFPNDEISLHFLMQGRAEIRAVKRKHSGLGQFDVERFRFTRVHDHVDIVFDQAKPVNHIPRLLDIRDVHG